MISLLWFLLSFSTTGQQEWTWKAFPESGFKILTPCAMEHNLTKVPTATGHIEYHQYKGGSLTDKDHGTLFTIDHYALDEAIGGDDAYLEEFFTTTVDEILQSVKGTLIYNE